MKTKEVALWTCKKDAEYLTHDEIDEAIHDYLDSIDELPDTVTVYGHARMTVDKKRFKNFVLENAQEWLDENYGGEDGHDTDPKAEEALDKFISAYIETFTPWQCEEVEQREINVAEWVTKHCPDWLYK